MDSSRKPGDSFGNAVAFTGAHLVIGAPADRTGRAGAVHVYARGPGGWTFEQKLAAEDGSAGNAFGAMVVADGDTVIVGAPFDHQRGGFAGAAYVFAREQGRFLPRQKLTPANRPSRGFFGSAMALTGDRAIIGANGGYSSTGAAYVFERSGGAWTLAQDLSPPADDAVGADGGSLNFGFAVALEGERAAVSALYTDDYPSTGIVYVFARVGGSWKLEQRIVTPVGSTDDCFGAALALRGDVLTVGAVAAVHVFARRDGAWSAVQKLEVPDPPGVVLNTDPLARLTDAVLDGDLALFGSGSCFARRAGRFELLQQLMPAPRSQSRAPALAMRGDTAVIGFPKEDGCGAVHVFVAAPVPP